MGRLPVTSRPQPTLTGELVHSTACSLHNTLRQADNMFVLISTLYCPTLVGEIQSFTNNDAMQISQDRDQVGGLSLEKEYLYFKMTAIKSSYQIFLSSLVWKQL